MPSFSIARRSSVTFAAVAIACALAGRSGADPGEGLFLTWNACAQSAGATHDLFSSCNSDVDEQVLNCAFTLASPLDSVIALEIVLDLQVAGGTMPDWWQDAPGGCRANALLGTSVFPGNSPCEDFWRGRAAPIKQPFYTVGQPRGGAAQARIVLAFALLPDSAVRLDAATMYNAARLRIRDQSTSACAGCLEPACFVLNSILVGRLPGTPGGDLLLQTPGPGLANRATWQGGAGECAAVPVRARSWGQIKTLYR